MLGVFRKYTNCAADFMSMQFGARVLGLGKMSQTPKIQNFFVSACIKQ